MEYRVDTFPGRTIYLALFCDVTNSKELLDLMQTGALHPELAFLNASLIPDTFPLLAAAHKSLVSHSSGKIRTRTLHSELVHNYSGSKHIRESLQRFGITNTTSYVLVGRFDATSEDVDVIRSLVQGTEVDLSELSKRADQGLLQKHYKISSIELEGSSVEDAITTRIAARDAL